MNYGYLHRLGAMRQTMVGIALDRHVQMTVVMDSPNAQPSLVT